MVQLYAQSVSDYDYLKNKYPDEQAVIINYVENVVIDVENDKYKISEEVIKKTLILKNGNEGLATDKVYNSLFRKIKKIDAKTLVPDGKKFRSLKVDKFVEQNDQSDLVFYDEVVSKKFVYPGVQKGCITSLKYNCELTEQYALSSFYFKWHVPCEISQLNIKADKRARLKFKLYNADTANIAYSYSEKGKYDLYSWTAKNIKSSQYQEDAPSIRYYFPHIAYYIDNYYPSDTSSDQFKGLKSLYKYYYSLINNLNSYEDTLIHKTVNNIISGANTEQEKVKRIYYWVQDNINYIAFEEGMQGIIPEKASSVFNKRYGDCKGMSSLLNYMIKLAGIESHLTWIGARNLPYKYTDIASPLVDNHMIVTYFNGNTPVFLDATNNYAAFGIPSSMIQGKQALIEMGENNYKIEEVPVQKSDKNLISDSSFLTINGDTLKGHGLITLTGYEKIDAAYTLTGSDKIKLKERVLHLISKGSNKFFIDSFRIENLSNREVPLKIYYTFRLNDYFKKIDRELYLNLNLDKSLINERFEVSKRNMPVENKHCSILNCYTEIEIPQGYKTSFLPQNSTLSSDRLSFNINYSHDQNKIILCKEIVKNFLLLQPSDFNEWNKIIDSLSLSYRDAIVFKKN